MRLGDEGVNMLDLDFERMVLIICFVHNSLLQLLLQFHLGHLSFIEDIENFEGHPWGIDVHEELPIEVGCARATY